MVTIIKDKETLEEFVLLGSGFGKYHSKSPGAFLGNWSPDVHEGEVRAICACNKNGDIVWLKSEGVEVVSINGKKPSEYF